MRVRNWKKFQHFKNRRPPWIKLYRDILDDEEWGCLSGEDKGLLVELWLLASEDKDGNGQLPSPKAIAYRTRTSIKKILPALSRLSHWLDGGSAQGDDKVISPCRQFGSPEREREGETERETEAERETDMRTEDSTLVRSAKPRSKPPVITIPLVKGQEHAISEDDIAEWQACFPGVDVLQQLRSIRAWNLANPSRRKTARGIKNHVRSWLEKDQNRGGHKGNGNGQGRETVMDHNLRVVREMQAAREADSTKGTTYEHEGNGHASK